MLLARKGYRVLLVDRATFPSDTISTHIIHPPGVAALKRWGLLDRLQDSGCPPFSRYSFDFGPFTLAGSLRPVDGTSHALCPRRTVLDKLLVDAAVEAGAELLERFSVDEVEREDGKVVGIRGRAKGGAPVTYRGRVVIGADGQHSTVAKAVQAERYNERPTISATYYAYWSNFPTEGLEAHVRPRRAFIVAPTNDGLTMTGINWPRSDFEANRNDVAGEFERTFEMVPKILERWRGAKLESRFVGIGDLPNFFCKPYGPGWALVGDAGYHKDPTTAQGISDAFRDAEFLVGALDEVFAGKASFDDAMSRYQSARDEASMPMFELTCQLANLEEPPPPDMLQLLAAVHGNQEAMNDFVSVFAGVVPPPVFFSPDNIGRIMAAAAAGAPN
jgi:2-polyprenyl-6-methoxyphenol hydroxylase-like FAD-dependent oxidoreductase